MRKFFRISAARSALISMIPLMTSSTSNRTTHAKMRTTAHAPIASSAQLRLARWMRSTATRLVSRRTREISTGGDGGRGAQHFAIRTEDRNPSINQRIASVSDHRITHARVSTIRGSMQSHDFRHHRARQRLTTSSFLPPQFRPSISYPRSPASASRGFLLLSVVFFVVWNVDDNGSVTAACGVEAVGSATCCSAVIKNTAERKRN